MIYYIYIYIRALTFNGDKFLFYIFFIIMKYIAVMLKIDQTLYRKNYVD